MTTQSLLRVTSLSAELARPSSDARRESAQRWHASLHHLCVLRATTNETTYETEWQRIFDDQLAIDNMAHGAKLLALAAVDVLRVQREHRMMLFGMEGIPYDQDVIDEHAELLAVMRLKIANELP